MLLYVDLNGRLSAAQHTSTAGRTVDSQITCRIYCWDNGSMKRLPKDWEFPDVSLMVAWGLWWEGDAEKQLPPFRMFRTDDCGTKKTRKRLSDWKVIMDKLKQLSGFTGHSPASPIIVDQLFEIGVSKLFEVVPKNKNRAG